MLSNIAVPPTSPRPVPLRVSDEGEEFVFINGSDIVNLPIGPWLIACAFLLDVTVQDYYPIPLCVMHQGFFASLLFLIYRPAHRNYISSCLPLLKYPSVRPPISPQNLFSPPPLQPSLSSPRITDQTQVIRRESNFNPQNRLVWVHPCLHPCGSFT